MDFQFCPSPSSTFRPCLTATIGKPPLPCQSHDHDYDFLLLHRNQDHSLHYRRNQDLLHHRHHDFRCPCNAITEDRIDGETRYTQQRVTEFSIIGGEHNQFGDDGSWIRKRKMNLDKCMIRKVWSLFRYFFFFLMLL